MAAVAVTRERRSASSTRGEQPPVHLTWYHGGKRPAELEEIEAKQAEKDGKKKKRWGAGTLFVGDKGMLLADYDTHALLPEEQADPMGKGLLIGGGILGVGSGGF